MKTIGDFTSKDKIALPAGRTSIEAVVLTMVAEKTFGNGKTDKLDLLTVAMGHLEAMKALLSGNSGVDAHVASAPFL